MGWWHLASWLQAYILLIEVLTPKCVMEEKGMKCGPMGHCPANVEAGPCT